MAERIKLIGVDTETHDGVPYSIQVSLADGTAIMVLLSDREAVKELGKQLRWLLADGWIMVFHYAPADLPITEEIVGFRLDGLYRDTMLEGYGFGGQFGRLGLKMLARRVLGRQRLSWEETVTPWSKEILSEWICRSFTHAEANWQRVETQVLSNRVSAKTGKPLKDLVKSKLVRSTTESALLSIYGYMLANSEYPSDMTLWEKIEERIGADARAKLATEVSPMPARGIAHCPLDVQIEYACSDPDDTRQLAVQFERMRREFVESLNVQDEDWDN